MWELEFDAILLDSEVAPEARRALFKPCMEDHQGQMVHHTIVLINCLHQKVLLFYPKPSTSCISPGLQRIQTPDPTQWHHPICVGRTHSKGPEGAPSPFQTP